MSISLTTINSYAGTGGILLNAQQTGLESAGFFHRLKSFFNFGDARAKNRATLDAIRTAVLSDPRFAPADLQAQARHLLDGVRTDRAIDISQIKGLVKALKKLADPTNPAALDRRVELHMAGGRNLPPEYEKYASEVTYIAKLKARQIAAEGNPVDIADVVKRSLDTFKSALFRDPLKHYDRTLTDFICRNIRTFAVDKNHMLRADDVVTNLVRSTVRFYVRANKTAYRLINERNDIAPGIQQRASYTHAYASAAFEFMDTVGMPLTPDHFDIIENYASTMSRLFKQMLRANPTEAQVRTVVSAIERQMHHHRIDTQSGKPLFGKDDDANVALARYVGRLMSLNLPDATRDAIRTHMQVESTDEFFAQKAYEGICQNSR